MAGKAWVSALMVLLGNEYSFGQKTFNMALTLYYHNKICLQTKLVTIEYRHSASNKVGVIVVFVELRLFFCCSESNELKAKPLADGYWRLSYSRQELDKLRQYYDRNE